MSGSKHTPLPWRQSGVAFEIKDATGETVGVTLEAVDAALIVRAVNAHAGLLAACEEMYRILQDGMTADYDEMTAALGRARTAVAMARGA
jgi:hypothetical protein